MQGEMPPLDFLLSASTKSLEDLELAALNRANNLVKGIKAELHALSEQTAAAMLARWMLENRESLLRAGRQPIEIEPLRDFDLFSTEKVG